MNVQHKCLFHNNNSIVKFCQNRQCTLPLCIECEPIHINEHNLQQSDARVIRFNEATLKAANDMEDYLDCYKKYTREQDNKIENDREIVIRMVDEYYSLARKMMTQIRENAEKVEEHLSKLKKGSIKTLIFYYSGDIKLDGFDLEFEPLQNRVKALLQNRQERSQKEERKVERNYPASRSSGVEEKKYASNESEANQPEPQRNVRNTESEGDNVFSNIQEIKDGRSRQRTRKSIFDHNSKKNSMITANDNKEPEYKYNYQHFDNQPKEEPKHIEPSPKFHYDINQDYKYPYDRNEVEEQPLSFENRFLSKFTGGEHEGRFKVEEAIKRETARYEIKKYEDEVHAINNKVLKPSDLQIEKENDIYAPRQVKATSTISQRNRSLSQNNLVEKQTRKSNFDYDLKKQVLSPDEIRKMLEKKIEERNRILSIKKSDNYPVQVEEKGRRGWETRDSIINQIYADPKQ